MAIEYLLQLSIYYIFNDCCPHLSLQNQAGWREARASAYTRPSRHWPGSWPLPPVRLSSQCCRGEAASTMVTAVSLAHHHHTCSPPRVPPHTGPWSPAGVTVPGLQSAPAHCSYIGRISPPHPWPSGPPSSLWRPACSLQCCSAAVIRLCKYRRLNHCNPLSAGHSDTVCMQRGTV